jgi:alcohol dehydrogenase class IV
VAGFLDFRHITPASRVFCGHDALTALPAELDRCSRSRAVLVCGRSMLGHPDVLGRIRSLLGNRLAGQFADVKEHSPVPVVEAARRTLETLAADAVIAVGGGSAIVTARAATILLAEKRPVHDLATHRDDGGRLVSPRLLAPKLPIWLVPSTPTTALAKAGSAVRDPDTGHRLALFDPKTRAQGVFLDPGAALTAPESLACGSALNAFSMAVESIQGNVGDPLAEGLLTNALRGLADWLPRLQATPDDATTRLQLMVGALLAGQGSDYAGGGLAQALAHAAGPRSDVPNGIVEATLLPHTISFNASAVPGQLRHVADVLGQAPEPDASADEQAVAQVQRLLTSLRVPARLRELGVRRGALSEIAEHAMDDWTLTRVPRTVKCEDLIALLEAAW